LDEVLCGRVPALEDLPNLANARIVIQESLRLYPPVWTISRRTIEEDEIGEYRTPAGTTVIVSPYVVHHNPAVWEEPEVFDPERFSPERFEDCPAYAFFPFDGRPRKCIGSEFAMMEATVALATVARRYRLRLVPNQLVEPEPAITLAPRHVFLMKVEERTDDAMRLLPPTLRNRAER
jgi:cytochrome P450